MSVSLQFSQNIANKRREDELDVKGIMKGLEKDDYTPERLQKLLTHSQAYKAKHGGSRGNRNMIKAVQALIQKFQV